MGDWDFAVYGQTELIREHHHIALTIGNFDGVHRGHKHIIDTLKNYSFGLPAVALTFDPHPSEVLSPANAKSSILPLSERIDLLLSSGLQAVVVQKFNKSFAELSADDFVSKYLMSQFRIARAVVGFDFCYGTGRQGDWKHFDEASTRHGFLAFRADPLIIDGAPVSSSRIRSAVTASDFQLAERLLGRPFSLSGIVVKGDQRGRQIGFPTANLGMAQERLLLPHYGVFAVEVLVEGENNCRLGVMNCGVRPTIAAGLRLQIETHILDYSGDLYGKRITFRLRKFIRSEMKFSNLEQLRAQIQSDSEAARNFFRSLNS